MNKHYFWLKHLLKGDNWQGCRFDENLKLCFLDTELNPSNLAWLTPCVGVYWFIPQLMTLTLFQGYMSETNFLFYTGVWCEHYATHIKKTIHSMLCLTELYSREIKKFKWGGGSVNFFFFLSVLHLNVSHLSIIVLHVIQLSSALVWLEHTDIIMNMLL